MANQLSAALFRDELVGSRALRSRIGLMLHGCRIDVRSNNRRLMERLAYYYKDRLSDGPLFDIRVEVVDGPIELPPCDFQMVPVVPGKKPKEEIFDVSDGRFVHKVRTGMLFVITDQVALACGPAAANEPQVVNFINARFMAWLAQQGCLVFHAAGVSSGRRGLVLAGKSGMGKSSLALWLLSQGANFVSNDRLMIRRVGPDLEMVGIPKMPRINPGTLVSNPDLHLLATGEQRAAYRALPPNELWELEEKYDVMIDECFGPGRLTESSPTAGMVLLNWQRNSEKLQFQQIDIRQRQELLPAFQKELGVLASAQLQREANVAPSFEDYCIALEGCPVFEVTGGVDFEAAARGCMEFLVSGSLPVGLAS